MTGLLFWVKCFFSISRLPLLLWAAVIVGLDLGFGIANIKLDCCWKIWTLQNWSLSDGLDVQVLDVFQIENGYSDINLMQGQTRKHTYF